MTFDVPPLREPEFVLFRDLIHKQAGIWLGPTKQALLFGRLGRRVRELQLRSFGAYFRHLVSGADPEELTRMLECICTHETHFFREPRHFTFLEEQLFPYLKGRAAQGLRSRHVKVWSAGCSTGEEPYSLAISLSAHLPAQAGWTCEVLATDLSSRVLEKAREGIFPVDREAEIPRALLTRFVLQGTGTQEGRIKARPELRSMIRFERLNLNDASYPVDGPFDFIFCRNVLIYFEQGGKRAVIERLVKHLGPDGLLFLGHAESLLGVSTGLTALLPTVYARGQSAAGLAMRPAG